MFWKRAPISLRKYNYQLKLCLILKLLPPVINKVIRASFSAFIINVYNIAFVNSELLGVINDWWCNIDNGLINGVFFLDIRKTFDTTNHEIFLGKLEHYGFQEQSLLWMTSYLKDRKQFYKLNHNLSSVKSTHCGIPQGSNLGPLLFLIYINDPPNCLEESVPSLFADDTNISVSWTSLN